MSGERGPVLFDIPGKPVEPKRARLTEKQLQEQGIHSPTAGNPDSHKFPARVVQPKPPLGNREERRWDGD